MCYLISIVYDACVLSKRKVLEPLVEDGREAGLGVESEEGEEDFDVLSENNLVELTDWIEAVSVGANGREVCPEFFSRLLLVRLQVRH